MVVPVRSERTTAMHPLSEIIAAAALATTAAGYSVQTTEASAQTNSVPILRYEADGFPIVDVEKSCKILVGADNIVGFNACIEKVPGWYDGSRLFWSTAPTTSRRLCL